MTEEEYYYEVLGGPIDDDPRNDPDIVSAVARLKRQTAVMEFEKQTTKELIEFSRKPWWVQQVEEGDYHFNNFDLDQEED